MNNHETSASLATLAIAAAVIAIAMLVCSVTEAPAGLCLSHKDARTLWPKRHLYWYSRDHCWSNRRGPPRGIKMDPINNIKADPVMDSMAKEEPPSHDAFLKAKPMPMMDPFTLWHERIEGLFK